MYFPPPPFPTPFVWGADASLTNAAAQYLGAGGRTVSSLTVLAGVVVAKPGPISTVDIAFVGNAGNVAQTITGKIQRSTDHGVTFADVPGASSGALATTAGGQGSSISFPSVFMNQGDILIALATPSAPLGAVVTDLVMSVG